METPSRPMVLYDFESCPHCHRVRVVLSTLQLDYLAVPCGRQSRHRREVIARGGVEQFPYLIDPNTGREMYESHDIVDYLHQQYGSWRTRVAWAMRETLVGTRSSPSSRPTRATPGQTAEPRLELFNDEWSADCRQVRELLVELDLRYTVRNTRRGRRIPCLVDHDRGVTLDGTVDILAYLRETYAV